MRLKEVILYELRYLFRDNPKMALILFGIPILLSILFGLAYNAHVVKYVPTVIYDQENTASSRTLIRAFADSERFDIVGQVSSQEELDQYMYDNKAVVSIVIPEKFSQNVKRSMASQLLLEINASNLMFANSILSSAQEIVATLTVGAGSGLLEGINQLPKEALNKAAPVRIAVRVLNNPTTSYNTFILAGLGANGLQLGIMLAICTILIRELQQINRWQGISSPIIVLGKILPYWLISTLSYLVYLFVIYQVFLVPCKGSILELLLIGSAFTFAIVNVGTFFSTIAPDEVYSIQLPMLYIMPAFLFSGYSWPHLAMTSFSRIFSSLLPIAYAADSMRDLMLAGYAPDLLKNSEILFGLGLVLFILSSIIFSLRRKKQQKVHSTGVVA